MSSFGYVDSLSNNNEKILKMRAKLIDNREGLINGRLTSQPTQKQLDKVQIQTPVVKKSKHMKMNSSQERDFKNHMREALSTFKISKNEVEKTKFEQKTRSLAIVGT